MPAHARKDIVRKGEIGIYHCWSRCVQRAFLCGEDPVTGLNYEYRRERIAKLLAYQASVFAVDVGNYSILSNHQHLIVRLRPDIAKTWSDEEVAWRWKLAWPNWIDGAWVRQPTDEDIEELLAQPEKIPILRENLSDLSWFMARWKEPISKMSNAESQTKGHFYEQRFGSRELVDEAANLSGNVYVDLNQVKAGMAKSLEECKYSGIYDRIHLWRQREATASLEEFQAEEFDGYSLNLNQVEGLLADCFLSPIGQGGPLILVDVNGAALQPIEISSTDNEVDTLSYDESKAAAAIQASLSNEDVENDATEAPIESENSEVAVPGDSLHSDSTATNPTRSNQPGSLADKKPTWKIHHRLKRRRRPRASDHVILDMPPEQYLKIVRFSFEQIGAETAHPPPEDVEHLLRNSGIEPKSWLELLENFETWFHHAVGSAVHLATTLTRTGRKSIHGIKASRDVFL